MKGWFISTVWLFSAALLNPISFIAVTANEFGPESNGVRCRLIPISADTDDGEPDKATLATQFATGSDVTFLVELKNVGDQPVALKGIRYGNSYGNANGRLNTSFFAPVLFDYEFAYANGDPVPRAQRTYTDTRIIGSGSSIHRLAPGETLKIVLRPAKQMKPMHHLLPAGEYRASVRYRVTGDLLRTKDKKAGLQLWEHEVRSNTVSFSVDRDDEQLRLPKLVWGPEHKGLTAAIELTKPGYIIEDPFTAPGVPVKSALGVNFHVKNVSKKSITFVSETGRQDDTTIITDAAGKKVAGRGAFFSGWPVDVRWVLEPDEVAVLSVLSPVINSFDKPGEYQLRYKIRFNGRIAKDGKGNQIFPLPDDWQDVLDTGTIKVFLRERTIEDDDRAKPPNFIGKVKFVSSTGEPIESGSFSFRGQIKNKYHANRLIKAGEITIPDCTLQPVTITVRADGFEEQRFSYVELKPNKVKVLTLQPAKPAQFRLVRASDGKPVANAKIRRFNKSYAKVASGPYPTDELKGPIWATSDPNGLVKLTSLEVSDPKRKELGNALYYFYVEPASDDLAPRFVGPIKAGQHLGNLKIGEFVEVQGEVHGTDEELKNFDATWDQPFEQTNDNPKGTFVYAKSVKLQTKRDGDKITFRLEGLRPDRLRIVANFGTRPHSIEHVWSRRKVGDSDVEVTTDLSDPVTKIIITPDGKKE